MSNSAQLDYSPWKEVQWWRIEILPVVTGLSQMDGTLIDLIMILDF
jgi:hypothetical protein